MADFVHRPILPYADRDRFFTGLHKYYFGNRRVHNRLQVIGLIVAVYAMVRGIQVPLEMTATKDVCLGLPLNVRVFVVAGVSGFGFLVLAILTLKLLMSGSAPPSGF